MDCREMSDDNDFVDVPVTSVTVNAENTGAPRVIAYDETISKPASIKSSSNELWECVKYYPELGQVMQSTRMKSSKLDFYVNSHSKDNVKEWIQQFSQITDTNWVLKRTEPKKKTVVYACQFSSKNKTRNPDHHCARNKACPAVVSFRLGTPEVQTRIRVNWVHNHLNNFRNLSMLRMSEEVISFLCSSSKL